MGIIDPVRYKPVVKQMRRVDAIKIKQMSMAGESKEEIVAAFAHVYSEEMIRRFIPKPAKKAVDPAPKPKRKRRTKAQMEAARAAEAAKNDKSGIDM